MKKLTTICLRGVNARANSILACCVGLALAWAATSASAATIGWLNQAPTPFGSSVPNNSVFNLPGVGNVTVTYSIPATFNHARGQDPLTQNGNVPGYNWIAHEQFGATSFAPTPPATTQWRITYTFSGTIAANTIFVGIGGLGRTLNGGDQWSTATVNQNGLFLGEWTASGTYGANQFVGGPGTFTMYNSVTNFGGANPWWNSALGVVRILDPVSSLTVIFDQLPGDGAGVNIGAVVPEPATMGLLALGSLSLLNRKRRS